MQLPWPVRRSGARTSRYSVTMAFISCIVMRALVGPGRPPCAAIGSAMPLSPAPSAPSMVTDRDAPRYGHGTVTAPPRARMLCCSCRRFRRIGRPFSLAHTSARTLENSKLLDVPQTFNLKSAPDGSEGNISQTHWSAPRCHATDRKPLGRIDLVWPCKRDFSGTKWFAWLTNVR